MGFPPRKPYMPGVGGHPAGAQGSEQDSFSDFCAAELYCPKCGQSMPVRERLLLVLPSGDLLEYVCTECGASLGKKTGG